MASCEGLMNVKMKMFQCCLNFILNCCLESGLWQGLTLSALVATSVFRKVLEK